MLAAVRALPVLALALVAAACAGSATDGCARGTVEIGRTGPPLSFEVAIADDEAERATGLMGRRALGADEGMAFVYPEPVRSGFWMKDTTIPLSIAFWDDRGRVVDRFDMAPCAAEDCPVHEADAAYVGAVEVNRGALNGVEPGDRVRLEPGRCA